LFGFEWIWLQVLALGGGLQEAFDGACKEERATVEGACKQARKSIN
jgi:hypothetical protein